MKSKEAFLPQAASLAEGCLVPLDQAEDVRLCGSKARNLARLHKLGLPVPPGFVLTDTVFQSFLDRGHLRQRIAALCRPLTVEDFGRLRSAAQTIRELILSSPIEEMFRGAIAAWRDGMLPGRTLIVRSSAAGEDSADASYAGQLDSFPGVNSTEELEAAVRACWASYWSERALSYRLSKGIELHGMSVLIQVQVRSRVSGVLFTRRPERTEAGEGQMLGEYCFGHGDLMVSGQINPGRFTISRQDLRWRLIAMPEQALAIGNESVFDDAQMFALARAGLDLEGEFGCPQDIEWTIDHDGQLFLVQARPITVVTGATKPESLVVWSNANVNENFPEPISPLLYSIAREGYYHYFRNLGRAFGVSASRLQSAEQLLQNVIGVHGGKMYYNLTNIHSVLRLMPCGDLLADSFNHFVGTSQKPAPPKDAASFSRNDRSRLRKLVELCRIALKTVWQYLFLVRRIEAFERRITNFSQQTGPTALAKQSLADLRANLRSFLDIRFYQWTHAALADAAAMVSYGILKRLLGRAFPASDQAALHNTLLKGLQDVVSSVPAVKLWELSRLIREDAALARLVAGKESREILSCLATQEEFRAFKFELDAFLDQWGFRCSGELMLTVPSFQENPAALLDILKTYVGLEGESPAETLRRQGAERIVETERVLAELSLTKMFCFSPWPTQTQVVKRILSWTQTAIVLRERARLKQALLYSRVRQIALAIGDRLVSRGQLSLREDVFFLTYQEIDMLAAGAAMFPYWVKESVTMRKGWHRQLRKMTPPDAFELADGEYLTHTFEMQEGQHTEAVKEKELRGIGACGGKVMARAVILDDVSQANRLVAGDILVTRQTDPGWGLVFFLIKGLIMERGGMLSHGAIIAREYGIPTVVGVHDAMRQISEGSRVTVDGDRGLVRLMD